MIEKKILTLKEIASKSLLMTTGLFKANKIHPLICEKLMSQFLLAVIDDERDVVKSILEKNPELLLMEPISFDSKNPLVIESQLTGKKFFAEKAAMMAAKRKQIDMLELIFPYYDKLEHTDEVNHAKIEAIEAWTKVTLTEDDQGKKIINIPSQYEDILKPVTDIFEVKYSSDAAFGKLSEATELALSNLLSDSLLPEHPLKLDDCLDMELLLMAFYRMYRTAYYHHVIKSSDFLHLRVGGLIQKFLLPETAKIFCDGIDEVALLIRDGKNITISPTASLLQLKSGELFYGSPENKPGYHFYVAPSGYAVPLGAQACFPHTSFMTEEALDTYCQWKTARLEKLACNLAPRQNCMI